MLVKKKTSERSRGVELVVGQTTVADKDHKGGTLCLDTWVGPSSIRGKGLASLLNSLLAVLYQLFNWDACWEEFPVED